MQDLSQRKVQDKAGHPYSSSLDVLVEVKMLRLRSFILIFHSDFRMNKSLQFYRQQNQSVSCTTEELNG